MKLTLTTSVQWPLHWLVLPASALASGHSKVLGEGMSSMTSSSMMQGKTGHVAYIVKNFGVTPKHRQVGLERQWAPVTKPSCFLQKIYHYTYVLHANQQMVMEMPQSGLGKLTPQPEREKANFQLERESTPKVLEKSVSLQLSKLMKIIAFIDSRTR